MEIDETDVVRFTPSEAMGMLLDSLIDIFENAEPVSEADQ